MKLYHLVFFLGSFLWSNGAIAQDESSSITVILVDYATLIGQADITYILYQGSDSITSGTTNKVGEFKLELELEFQVEYSLSPINLPDSDLKDNIRFTTDYQPMDYLFEMTRASQAVHYGGQIAYFQPKEVKKIEEFEVEQILGIIRNRPNICIQFTQTIIRSESEKIATKRKVNFLRFLEENGVDMSCIQFEEDTRQLKAFDEDQRSRIQGAIYSIDSKCD